MHLRPLFLSIALIALVVNGSGIARAQTSGATSTVNAFYTWYIGTRGNWTSLTGARAYLTPSLYASLEKAVTIERQEQAEVLDFDPFSGAQAEATSYAAGTPSGNGTRAIVPVRIQLRGGNGSSMVRVIAVHGSTGWKIDNFIYGTGDLKHSLAGALK